MVAIQANYEAIWIHQLLFGLFGHELRPKVIHCDNQSCIKLYNNTVFHDK
jgi:hypothetical protein